jgi:hypothetical protein
MGKQDEDQNDRQADCYPDQHFDDQRPHSEILALTSQIAPRSPRAAVASVRARCRVALVACFDPVVRKNEGTLRIKPELGPVFLGM